MNASGLDSRAKLLALVAAMIGCVTTPAEARAAFAGYYAALLALAIYARVSPRMLVRNSLAIAPLIFMCAMFSLMRHDWLLLWNVSAKAVFGALAVTVFAATTPLPDLLAGLERLRAPRVFVMMAAFMYRYLGLFADEMKRMKRAHDSRCGRVRRIWQSGQIGHLAGALFLRSYEHGERVYMNMLARGYTGRFYPGRARRLRAMDYALVAITVAVFAGLRIAAE